MNGFEPTFLGIATYVIITAQINEWLQALLMIATIIYTIIKIVQLLKNK